jgi:colicin import membrane protein
METNLIKISAESYGIQESKAKELEAVFTPFIEILKQLEGKRDLLMNKEITNDLCIQAHNVRMEAVKFRTGIEKVHKQAKEDTLKTGRAIDGWKNLLLNASAPIENDTMNIEKHFELLEAERIENLQTERASLIMPYSPESAQLDLGRMTDQIWNNFFTGTKASYEEKIAAEKKAEQDRIEKQKVIDAENERIRIENEELKRQAEEKEKAAEIERRKQADILAKQKAESDKKAKAEAEKQAKILADERERAAKEKAIVDAKLKAEQEERAKIQAELEARQEAEQQAKEKAISEEKSRVAAEKKAAKAPDKVKLINWVDSFRISEISELKSVESNDIADNIAVKFNAFKLWAKTQIEIL